MIFDIIILSLAFYIGYWRKRGRIRVKIKTPLGEREEWKKPKKDGKTIVMVSARGKRPGWKFTFTNKALYRFKRFLGRIGYGVDVIYDSPKAIEYDYENKESDRPMWDKETSYLFILAEVLKRRAEALKVAMPTIIWILILLGIMNLILSGYQLVR